MSKYEQLWRYIKDNLQDEEIIKDFCNKFNCELSILENGERYFHTEEQLE